MLRGVDFDGKRYWFRLRRSNSVNFSVKGFIIAPTGARGWLALLGYFFAAVGLPMLVRLHGPFGWALVGGEMLLLLGFACVVLATCNPYEPSRYGD